VVAGLDALATPPLLSNEGWDQRWPDLTNAIHWVVDDTWWDYTDPAESVGELLVNEAEAQALAEVVALVVAVGEAVGAEASDAAWASHPSWPRLQRAAASAAALLRRSEG